MLVTMEILYNILNFLVLSYDLSRGFDSMLHHLSTSLSLREFLHVSGRVLSSDGRIHLYCDPPTGERTLCCSKIGY